MLRVRYGVNKHPQFVVRQAEPFNGGAPPELLRQHPRTPNDLFFVRSHGNVPVIDAERYRLQVGGAVTRGLLLSLSELGLIARRHTVEATLQCAGNRRHQMNAVRSIPDEVLWGDEAVSNAEWSGVLLRDVLELAGVAGEARHVAFLGRDEAEKAPDGFGGSIPLDVALHTPVLLADTMNGEPLPPEHGYPLRVIVPGYIGARSVKWLSHIFVQAQTSDNYYQQHAYKLFPASAAPDSADWNAGLMLGDYPVNSVIWQPLEGEAVPSGSVTVRGHALVGGGRTVERVDVSADGGKTWAQAAFATEAKPYVWRMWEITLVLPPGEHEIVARAWDSAANVQPDSAASIWNFKGYMNNACHRLRVRVIEG